MPDRGPGKPQLPTLLAFLRRGGSGLPPTPQGEEGGSPDDFAVTEELRAADEAASLVHDYIWGKNDVTKEQANDAIWKIHNTLRPLVEVTDLGF